MKLEKEQIEKIALGAIGAVIALIVLVSLIFGPNIKRIGELRAKISEEKAKVLKAEKEVLDLNRIELNLKNTKDKIEEYENELPGATDAWLLGILNKIAEQTGVNFDKRERRGYTVQIGEYRLLEVDLDLKAGYHKLGEFINQLERSSRFISVWNLSIIGNEENIKKHNIRFTVGAFVGIPKEEEEK